jgi:patatin-like phospholipase/acyl hydrolase
MRMPEKVMACGHALCDSCIKIFGQRSYSERNTFELSECLLCGVSYSSSAFRFVPPTAGIRALTLDGGGVRGVIPLKFLEYIEKTLRKFCCPIQEYFDFVCGTSTGGLIAIGMFLLQWNTSESLQRFEDIARRTFTKQTDRVTLFAKALELLVAYIRDGQYSLSAIQEAFKLAFNSEIKMFNPLRNDTKVAVTTVTTTDSLPRLFTNYNGGKRPAELGYDVVRAKRAYDDISISEA